MANRPRPGSLMSNASVAAPDAVERTERRRENVTIAWLLFGCLAFGVGWLVGVNLLWRSLTWSRSEKLLGTLVLPGGLWWALSLAPEQVAAPGGVSLSWSWWGVIALVLPLASAAVLVYRARSFHSILRNA